MIIVSYDISDDKLRTRFSKFLSRFGHRMQFSVYEINNSKKMLGKIKTEIANEFEKSFSQSDSVLIFILSNTCEIIKYGYAKNEENDIVLIK